MRDLELAAAFSHALPYLALPDDPFGKKHGGEHSICMAIDQAHMQQDISWTTKCRAQEVIRKRLGEDVGYISTWLAKRGYISANQTWGEMILVQEYRHLWLAALAAEFRGRP